VPYPFCSGGWNFHDPYRLALPYLSSKALQYPASRHSRRTFEADTTSSVGYLGQRRDSPDQIRAVAEPSHENALLIMAGSWTRTACEIRPWAVAGVVLQPEELGGVYFYVLWAWGKPEEDEAIVQSAESTPC